MKKNSSLLLETPFCKVIEKNLIIQLKIIVLLYSIHFSFLFFFYRAMIAWKMRNYTVQSIYQLEEQKKLSIIQINTYNKFSK